MAEKVRKRSGKVENFSRAKLLRSVHVSLHGAKVGDAGLGEKIAGAAISKLKGKKIADAESIRSAVCYAMRKSGHHEACDFYSLVWLHAKPVRVRRVVKRHGGGERFSPEKLFKSVQKSFTHAHERDGRRLQAAVKEIFALLDKKYRNREVASVEIKDIIEYVLVRRKLDKVAKHYIMYRYM